MATPTAWMDEIQTRTIVVADQGLNVTPPKYDKEENTTTSDLQQQSSDEVETEQVISDDDVEVDEVSDYNAALESYTYIPSHEIEEFNDGGITFSRS